MKKELEKFLEPFKQEVSNRAKSIDPENTQDWYSITLGWAIAKGMSTKDAHEFSVFVRYSTNLA
jgi:hypothetical protein